MNTLGKHGISGITKGNKMTKSLDIKVQEISKERAKKKGKGSYTPSCEI